MLALGYIAATTTITIGHAMTLIKVQKIACGLMLFILSSSALHAANFKAHCRDRSPELIPTRMACIGPVADVVQTALQRMGHQIKWEHKTWDETIEIAETGGVDLLLRHSMSAERKQFLDEVAYGYEVREVFYYLSPSYAGDVRNKAELNKLRVGALEGSIYSAEFAENSTVTKVEFSNTNDLIEALESGSVDAVVTSSAHDMDRIHIVPQARRASYIENFYNGRYVSIPKASKRSKYFEEFKQTIEAMAKSGEVTEIFNRYGLKAPDQIN
ncbi:transporter substrate-binding domain-containing protein [Reinekea marina]|nr:transporter substrate-binding domain-containing protein [Reinekea marina]MDN3648085.1 transporter substrate-binding domain-containing protein [Reinekea marina]